MLRSGESRERHRRQKETDEVYHVWGTASTSAKVGSWPVCLGEEGEEREGRDRAGNTGGGSVRSVLQCQSRERGPYGGSSGEPKGLVRSGWEEDHPSAW